MANRYANLEGSKKISEDFGNINIGFDRVQAEMDTKGTPADAQAKADAAKTAAIAASAADLAAHKARGADEHPTAKGNAAGFQSAADKLKSDASTSAATPDTLMQRDTAGRAKVAAPAATDDIARKAETDAVQSNLDSHTGDTVKHVTQAEHDKLNGITAGAEVNQNAFAVINDVEASSKSDTVIFVGGTGITVTTDPEGKRIVLTATGEATPGAHASSHITGGTDVIPDAETGGVSGLMSGPDAQYLRVGVPERFDEIEEYVADQIAAIPPVNDATLTDKGIVQLSNATDGESESVAATEKAVNDARMSAISASKLYLDERDWQKHALTQEDGNAKFLPQGFNLNDLKEAGTYLVFGAVNAPVTGVNLIVEVISGTGSYVIQRVMNPLSSTSNYYQRHLSGSNWRAWSVDLFTSVSDGKTAIAAAITGKGVAASGSDTFPQLATKIGQISTGPKYASGTAVSSSAEASFRAIMSADSSGVLSRNTLVVSGLSFRPTRIIIRPNDADPRRVTQVYDASKLSIDPSRSISSLPANDIPGGGLGSVYNIEVSRLSGSNTSTPYTAYTNDVGFLMPVSRGSTNYIWEAFGV
ncbi:pyocin knob domain-containing protein [Paenibacillus sp. FSL H8-0317]|uniref:pyocin knob domain-containing protein n=1 Tax=Paenibacillus sp. FSL H8-0317 TaxID=2921385 RepID=UPI00324E7802